MADPPGLATILANIQAQLQQLGDRIGQVEQPQPQQAPPAPPHMFDHGAEVTSEEDDFPPQFRRVRHRERRVPEDIEHHGQPRAHSPHLKITPPTFAGKVDPEAYLDWERRMDHIFEVYGYEEPKKVAYAAAQLTDHALTWWDQDAAKRRRCGEGPIHSWEIMKFMMQSRYIPPLYHRELQKKFRNISQGSRSVEEYYGEFEHLRNRLNLGDTEEILMAQFLDGLQEKIASKVEMYTYHDLNELLHLATQVEGHLKRKNRTRAVVNTPWKSQASSSTPPPPRQHAHGKSIYTDANAPSKPLEPATEPRSDTRGVLHDQKTREIMCFKCKGRGHYARACPNPRAMIITPSGDYESQDEMEPQEAEDETEE